LSSLAESDESLAKELEEKIIGVAGVIKKEEFRIFLSGQYDNHNALLEVFAGAGGQDSQDWATMLLRMYERYCTKKGFKAQVLHQSFGDPGGPEGRIGTKSATLEIKGNHAYGFLKHETGVHRLVRISPFSSQKLRHTSFALVEVLPEIQTTATQIEIKPEDLKIDTFRASGPGGQYVNKTESAIRITHIPSGIVVSSQSERLQGKNKEHAMKILYAKLHQLKEKNQEKELKEIKGESISASWGNQIRSYVLHPYKMVKDLRTQYETSDAEGVLNGDLDAFVQEEIKLTNK
jgi:peptide chain release factor 2